MYVFFRSWAQNSREIVEYNRHIIMCRDKIKETWMKKEGQRKTVVMIKSAREIKCQNNANDKVASAGLVPLGAFVL